MKRAVVFCSSLLSLPSTLYERALVFLTGSQETRLVFSSLA
jgi:hypothetical protein